MTQNNDKNRNITFKEYFDTRFNELKNYMDIKFTSIEKSTCLAQENLNSRLENMNEFRNSMKDQASQYITRMEHETLISKYDSDIRILREAKAEAQGKASQQSVNVVTTIAIISVIIGFVGIIIKFI